MVGRRFFLHMRSWVQVYWRSRSLTMITILGIIKSGGKDERMKGGGKRARWNREGERREYKQGGMAPHTTYPSGFAKGMITNSRLFRRVVTYSNTITIMTTVQSEPHRKGTRLIVPTF